MTRHHTHLGPISPRMDEDDDENTPLRAPVVEAPKADKLNPEVEYEVLDLTGTSGEALKTKLNELGKDGWVLVAAQPSYIFRRLKKAEEEKKRGRVGFSV